MSDNYITICTEYEVDNPRELGSRILNWLQEMKYVDTEKSNCILSMRELGYKPGQNHQEAIGVDGDIMRWSTNGLQIRTERTVFDAAAFTAYSEMNCPKCAKNRFEGITAAKFHMELCSPEELGRYDTVFKEFEKWVNHQKTSLRCHHCKKTSTLEEYAIVGNISLSNLGFTFWNWPQIKSEVISQMETIIDKKLKVIQGHI